MHTTSSPAACPRCRHRIDIRSEYSGRRIFCPQCGAPLVAGPAAGAPPVVPSPVAPPPIPLGYGSYPMVAYAGFWIRLVAHLIDGLLLLIPAIIVNMIFPFVGGLVLGVMYEGWLVANWNGQTVGRRACGIRVISADGRPCDAGRAWGRAAARLINLLTAGLSFLIIPFDPRKRGLHDHLVQTLTVYVD